MAGMGPPPAEKKRHRRPDQFEHAKVSVPADATPDSPPELPGWEKYSTATLRWYRNWCESPQAVLFTRTDWQRLHMIAPLVEKYWAEPSVKLMAEIRLNEASLGATYVDRMRARIKLEQPKQQPGGPGTVADLNAKRRRRMSDAS